MKEAFIYFDESRSHIVGLVEMMERESGLPCCFYWNHQ
jgi:hypothetical protein